MPVMEKLKGFFFGGVGGGVGGLFLYHFCSLVTTNLAIPTVVFC